MSLAAITITVAIDIPNSSFSASTLGESAAAPSLVGAVDALAARLLHVHNELQDVLDEDLSQQGKDIRDTPLVFTP